MKSQHFLDSAQIKFVEVFKSQNPEYFDVVFVIKGKKLYAHKYRLIIISETFKAMFSDRWNFKNEPIEIKNHSFEDFQEFLLFIYSGECSFTAQNIFALVDLAEFYQISHLKELCDKYLTTNFSYSIDTIFKCIELANKYSMNRMKIPLQNFIVQNFKKILQCNEILKVDKFILEDLLMINCEYNYKEPELIFQTIYRWTENRVIQYKPTSNKETFNLNEAIKNEISTFLPYIEFKKMDQNFLNTFVVERSFIFSDNQFKDILENACPYFKVKVTNAFGESLFGILPRDSNAIKNIRPLKNWISLNVNNKSTIFWATNCKMSSPKGMVKKQPGIEWYLVCFDNGKNGDIGIRHFNDIDEEDDYLLTGMISPGKFCCTNYCFIDVE